MSPTNYRPNYRLPRDPYDAPLDRLYEVADDLADGLLVLLCLGVLWVAL